MNDLKAFCMTICIISLLSVLIRVIAPSRMKRQVEMAVSLFLLLCLLTPLTRLSLPDLGNLSGAGPTPAAQLDTELLLEREVGRRLEEAVFEKLGENGIFPEEIRIDITVAGDQIGIDAVSVALRVQDGQLSGRAQALAEDLLGTEVLVTAGREVQ